MKKLDVFIEINGELQFTGNIIGENHRNTYAWSQKPFTDINGTEWKGGQIDLVMDRNDNIMNLCEMKYAADEYVIDNDYTETVRNRMQLFRVTQKTKKDLRCTFVTVYGVKSNMYSGVVDNSVTLDALFT